MTQLLEIEKLLAAKEAVKLIGNNHIIGLGTGSTATYAIHEIGKLVKQGLQIETIPTSNKTKELAETLGIIIRDVNKTNSIDITIDGADEFTTDFILIKGGGGALLREKIVASMSKQVVIIADSSKKVDAVGKFKLPLEVIPFASNYVFHQLKALQATGTVRMNAGKPFLTDQNNFILDADFGIIENPVELSDSLNKIEGIVAHGLFLNLATTIIMGNNNSTTIFNKPTANLYNS